MSKNRTETYTNHVEVKVFSILLFSLYIFFLLLSLLLSLCHCECERVSSLRKIIVEDIRRKRKIVGHFSCFGWVFCSLSPCICVDSVCAAVCSHPNSVVYKYHNFFCPVSLLVCFQKSRNSVNIGHWNNTINSRTKSVLGSPFVFACIFFVK